VLLEIELALMPNNQVIPRRFLDLAKGYIKLIVDTFELNYSAGNEFGGLVSNQWKNSTTIELLQKNENKLSLNFDL
jgi:hypothetical protein